MFEVSGYVFGKFVLLHEGHRRLFEFCKSISSELTILLDCGADDTEADRRSVLLLETGLVDRVVTIRGGIREVMKRPEVKLLFSSRSQFTAEELAELREGRTIIEVPQEFVEKYEAVSSRKFWPRGLDDFRSRRTINPLRLRKVANSFDDIDTLTVGDLIVDVYEEFDAVGMSRETPSLVVRPKAREDFVGGAGIVAMHAAQLGAQTTFLSNTGDCSFTATARERMRAAGVVVELSKNLQNKTVVKKRMCVGSNVLLRINDYPNALEDPKFTEKLLEYIVNCRPTLVILSDFSYGTLAREALDAVIQACKKCGALVVADSQSSSQEGKIGYFNGVDLVSATEYEARKALGRDDLTPQELAIALSERLRARYCFLKMGAEGFLINVYDPFTKTQLDQDHLPATNADPVDPSGAGDCVLTIAGLGLAAGLDIWEASVLAALGAGVQVSRRGNIPITVDELQNGIDATENVLLSHAL